MANRENTPNKPKKRKLKRRIVIVVGSLKGGGGKSMIASNLSVALAYWGLQVLIIDADPEMHTSVQWKDDREEYKETHPDADLPSVSVVKKNGKLGPTIKEMRERFEVIIVDTGGRNSQELRSSLIEADILICPSEPTNDALDGIAPLLEVVSDALSINERLTTLVVMSRVKPGPAKERGDHGKRYVKRILDESVEMEAEGDENSFGFEPNDVIVLSSVITDRVIHPDIKQQGLTVLEVHNKREQAARDEFLAFTEEVIKKGIR